jgi:chemotaxis protein methyltransferase WspC
LIDPSVAAFLAERGGLVAASLGEGAVQAAHERRARGLGIEPGSYALRLAVDPEEARAFLEDVLIPETWFYRDHAPFFWITGEAAGGRWGRPLRALSLPCASGEEVYSVVIALLQAGLSPAQIEATGYDLSERALGVARGAVYGSFSLRGAPSWLQERHLQPEAGGVRVSPEVTGCVRLQQRNALDLRPDEAPYDLILCRNLLIYLDAEARRKLLGTLAGLLTREGALILGHADGWPPSALGLRPVGPPGAFAFERAPAARTVPAATLASTPRAPSFASPPLPPLASSLKPTPRPTPSPALRSGPTPTPRPAPSPASRAATPLAVSPAPSPALPRTTAAHPPPGASAAAPTNAQRLAEARELADRGRLDEARRLCEEHTERAPLDAAGHRLLGVIFVALGAPREAEGALRRALYLAPDDEETLTHLALLAERGGRPAQAASFRRRSAQARKEPS